MRLLGTLIFFLFGAALGAIIGALLAMMLAPESGSQLKVRIRERIDAGRRERDRVEAETAEAMKRQFRSMIGDPDALSGK